MHIGYDASFCLVFDR